MPNVIHKLVRCPKYCHDLRYEKKMFLKHAT